MDVGGAGQPLTNEDGQIVLTSSCGVVNHSELRHELEQRGHVFRSPCAAEVLVHGYEEWGVDVLQKLDGQFAFALYDRNRETVFLARDRFGIRPLFYAQRDGDLYFGSEIKAILASGEVDPGLDPRGLDEVLRLGAARPPRTPFSGIASLEPGTYGIWSDGALWLRHYYEMDYPEASEEPNDVIEQLDEIILRSVGLRMRADVPIGAYLSGALGSSITASLAATASLGPIQSFSVTYASPEVDRSRQQHRVAKTMGSAHTATIVGAEAIAESLPEVLWHTETPVLRTTPAMMFHLAKLAKQSGIKVVIAGDGADEVFLGNDVFKDASLRRGASLLEGAQSADPLFSHLPRFLGSRITDFYTRDFRERLSGIDVIGELRASLPTRFFGWSPLNQAAYLEMTTRLSPYGLAACGDRMTMAHGVEGRYPFLDHRLFEFAAALPTSSRLRGLRDKDVLRRWASRILPDEISADRNPPYRAPDAHGVFLPTSSSLMGYHIESDAVRRVGIFAAAPVDDFVRRCQTGQRPAEEEIQAMVGVLSTQIWYNEFIEGARRINALPVSEAGVLLGDTTGSDQGAGNRSQWADSTT
jgi:asparagine synthase (glutamine-hydrolysing)